MAFSPESFWDEKILGWERSRYESRALSGRSLVSRAKLAEDFLKKNCQGKTVTELGCGSGRRLDAVLSSGATRYVGYDFAPKAIEEGNERVRRLGCQDRASFHVADVTTTGTIETDLTFSLGLLDWLTKSQIETLFQHMRSPLQLHSFSEYAPFSVAQLLHRCYVFFKYGHKTKKYVPRYYEAAWLSEVLERSGLRAEITRDERMRFGAFIHTLK